MTSGQHKIAIPEDVFTQSFAMQYITLILFILIFSIAAYLPKDKIAKLEASKPVMLEAQVAKSPETAIAEGIISRSSEKTEAEVFAPWISLLNNHDLHIVVTVFRNGINESEVDSYALRIRELLLGNNLPEEAFIIQTRFTKGSDSEVHVGLYKGAEAWK